MLDGDFEVHPICYRTLFRADHASVQPGRAPRVVRDAVGIEGRYREWSGMGFSGSKWLDLLIQQNGLGCHFAHRTLVSKILFCHQEMALEDFGGTLGH